MTLTFISWKCSSSSVLWDHSNSVITVRWAKWRNYFKVKSQTICLRNVFLFLQILVLSQHLLSWPKWLQMVKKKKKNSSQLRNFDTEMLQVIQSNCEVFWLWIWILFHAPTNVPSKTHVLSQRKVDQNGHKGSGHAVYRIGCGMAQSGFLTNK